LLCRVCLYIDVDSFICWFVFSFLIRKPINCSTIQLINQQRPSLLFLSVLQLLLPICQRTFCRCAS